MKINIIGHKSPDTDSVVSSIVLVDLLEKKKGPLNFSDSEIEPKRTGKLNKETKFVLNYFKKETPSLVKSARKKNVFLVDHGGYEESVDKIKEAEIVGVLDHHRLGGISTDSPIFYRTEPLGSTSTILAKMFYENEVSLIKKQAGLLLAGILSDTLNLTSPTTTKVDKRIAKKLSEISKEDPEKLAEKMFQAKSDISDIPFKELIKKDYKEYKSGGTNFGIGVWETIAPRKIKENKEEILSALKKFKKRSKMDLIFFASIDIFKNEAEIFLLEEEREVAEKVFNKKPKDNLILLKKVSSRKKQLVPPLMKFFKKR